jgi:hypothetical protein
MADETPKPTWAGILRVYRWTLFASPRSSAAKLCTFFIVVAAIRVAFELLLPGAGVEYLSWDHLYDVGDPVADGLMWFLALMFVRERDMARVTVADLQGRVR